MQNNPPFLDEHLPEPPSPPRTPPQHMNHSEVPPTLSQASPCRNIWTTKGRSGIYVKSYPYLDGMDGYFYSICSSEAAKTLW